MNPDAIGTGTQEATTYIHVRRRHSTTKVLFGSEKLTCYSQQSQDCRHNNDCNCPPRQTPTAPIADATVGGGSCGWVNCCLRGSCWRSCWGSCWCSCCCSYWSGCCNGGCSRGGSRGWGGCDWGRWGWRGRRHRGADLHRQNMALSGSLDEKSHIAGRVLA